MSDMLTFITSLLSVIADWLVAEPMVYIVACAIALFVVRIVRDLISV